MIIIIIVLTILNVGFGLVCQNTIAPIMTSDLDETGILAPARL